LIGQSVETACHGAPRTSQHIAAARHKPAAFTIGLRLAVVLPEANTAIVMIYSNHMLSIFHGKPDMKQ
jgi:hypothetical protein